MPDRKELSLAALDTRCLGSRGWRICPPVSCLCWALLALSSTAQVSKSRCLGKSNPVLGVHPVYCVVAKEVIGFSGEQHLCLSDSEIVFFFFLFPLAYAETSITDGVRSLIALNCL